MIEQTGAPHGASDMVTIHDVAKAAGVSIATVSRTFSRPGRVNVHTRQHVLDVARRLGYRTETVDAQDEEQLCGLIGLVVTDLENPIAAATARSVQRACEDRSFGLMIMDSHETADKEFAIIKRSLGHVDGFILGSPRLPDSTIRNIAAQRPTVVSNRVVGGVRCVYGDEIPGITDAVRALKALGHREITYIPGPDNSWQNGLRLRAVIRSCRAEGLRFRRTPCAYPIAAHADKAFALFLERPTSAVIAFNDDIAMALIRFLQERDIAVPGRVSVVGTDDTPICTLCLPSLSSIHYPHREVAAMAANRIIDRLLHTGNADKAPIAIGSHFVARNSIGPIPA